MSTGSVHGYCPMGCGPTLFMDRGGFITCGLGECPNPSAVDTLLSDSETEHIVEFLPAAFQLQHPLRERIDGGLFECDLHQRLLDLDGPPAPVGRYRARRVGSTYTWEKLP